MIPRINFRRISYKELLDDYQKKILEDFQKYHLEGFHNERQEGSQRICKRNPSSFAEGTPGGFLEATSGRRFFQRFHLECLLWIHSDSYEFPQVMSQGNPSHAPLRIRTGVWSRTQEMELSISSENPEGFLEETPEGIMSRNAGAFLQGSPADFRNFYMIS